MLKKLIIIFNAKKLSQTMKKKMIKNECFLYLIFNMTSLVLKFSLRKKVPFYIFANK